MPGRGIARLDRRRPGGRSLASASVFSTRVVRLGPPANDNAPALRAILRMAAVIASAIAVVLAGMLLLR